MKFIHTSILLLLVGNTLAYRLYGSEDSSGDSGYSSDEESGDSSEEISGSGSGSGSDEDDNGKEENACFNLNPPFHDLNFQAGAWLNLFTDYAFQCQGYIESWEFYAAQSGDMYLSIWRPQKKGRAKLIAKNKVTATSSGKQTWVVPEDEKIKVQKGDLLGIQYDRSRDDVTGGVIPYEDSRYDATYGVTQSQLSHIVNTADRDEDLPVGTELNITPLDFVTRMPALKPHIGFLTDSAAGASSEEDIEIEPEIEPEISSSSEEVTEVEPETETCFNLDPPLIDFNSRSGAWLNLFTDYKFQCSGYLVAYDFYAVQSGDVYISVWRPQNDGKATLIAKNTISAIKIGKQTWMVPAGEEIQVQEGDLLGIQYDKTRDDVTGGVIPYEDSRYTATPGVDDDDLSAFVNTPDRNEALPVGTEIELTPVQYIWRMPALKPHILPLNLKDQTP